MPQSQHSTCKYAIGDLWSLIALKISEFDEAAAELR